MKIFYPDLRGEKIAIKKAFTGLQEDGSVVIACAIEGKTCVPVRVTRDPIDAVDMQTGKQYVLSKEEFDNAVKLFTIGE